MKLKLFTIAIFVIALLVLPIIGKCTEMPKPYEIVLIDDKVTFLEKDSISMQLVIRDLGIKKMIAPDLYWGLSVVLDGAEYKRDPKYVGDWNGPWEIIPKTAWRTGFSLAEYSIPTSVLLLGKHTIFVKDEFSKSNMLTIFIKEKIKIPDVVYTGGKKLKLTQEDLLSITQILKSGKLNIAYLEIDKVSKNGYYVYPEPKKDVIHSGEPYVFEKKGSEWILIRGPKLLKR